MSFFLLFTGAVGFFVMVWQPVLDGWVNGCIWYGGYVDSYIVDGVRVWTILWLSLIPRFWLRPKSAFATERWTDDNFYDRYYCKQVLNSFSVPEILWQLSLLTSVIITKWRRLALRNQFDASSLILLAIESIILWLIN